MLPWKEWKNVLIILRRIDVDRLLVDGNMPYMNKHNLEFIPHVCIKD